MVGQTLLSAGHRALQAVRDDLAGLWLQPASSWTPEPGLHVYDLAPQYGKRRIHLRVGQDGSGVLFVDVTDVIHLNHTAATMAKLALDRVSFSDARRRLVSRVRPSDKDALETDLRAMYETVDRLRTPDGSCPTCAAGTLENAPLFSVPAQAPYKVDIALTYGCNNACGHCYNEPGRFSMPSLSKDDWFVVIDKLHDIGVPHVIFTGGEATLHPELPELIDHAESLGLVTGLNSNGRRLADSSYTATLASAGLNHVQVTLGSNRPDVHDAIMGARSFDQTVRGIKNSMAAGIHCITNTTLMRSNKDHIAEIILFLHDIGIRTFAMNGMIYSGGGLHDPNAISEAEMPPILIRIRDQAADLGMRFLWYTPTEYCRMSPVELEIGAKRCNAAEYSICIEPSGDVLPCQSFYVSAGNILRDPWEDIWHGDLFHSFRDRNDHPRASGLPEKCWECPDLPLCGGGCRLEREAHSPAHAAGSIGTAPTSCGGGCSINGGQDPAPFGGFVASPGATSATHRARGGRIELFGIIDAPSSNGAAFKPASSFLSQEDGEYSPFEGDQ